MVTYNIYINIYAHDVAWGTETERFIAWLHPQALKRLPGVIRRTLPCAAPALKRNRATTGLPVVSKQPAKPGGTTL